MSDSDNKTALNTESDTEMVKPMVNVDGTPMCGDVDIKGNPYGVVEIETTTDSSMDSSYDSDFGFSSDDSFSSCDSGFMDDF
ncbi:hypothetical protein L2750_06080 [Shewanella submarina]|uniref:Uncharacterized protein n=1 Tax=Shewanella submarina TaxID=2016376 RepID=A0ABV7G8Q9_9GAMM|nr:hypothetical protein [Shewanella submarina]MCL1036718.1 hypothetical protein [Shewanella submarina]